MTKLAGPASPWLAYGEEVLHAEMVQAIAPGAAISMVLVKSTALNSTSSAVAASIAARRLDLSLGDIISISAAGQPGGEHCDTAVRRGVSRRGATVRPVAMRGARESVVRSFIMEDLDLRT